MAWTNRPRPTVDVDYWEDEDNSLIQDEDWTILLFDQDAVEGSNWLPRRDLP